MVEIIGNVIHVVIDFTDKQMKDRKRRRVKSKAARALRVKRNRARKK